MGAIHCLVESKIPAKPSLEKMVNIGAECSYGGGGGGGGTFIFCSYVGSGPASTVHPQKVSGISSIPTKYLKF